ncbi:hypothetical protein C8T65DRAFT_649842 [Cerioporus squamosus]|nr:hypothetical protein C8T65DRAFT_649842 [Cerioporus squamosus]
MPMLEELSIAFTSSPPELDLGEFSPRYEEDTELFLWAPRVEQFPRLRSLSLGRAVSIQGSMPVFPTLRKLDFHDFLPAPFTLHEFANFLLQHPDLEELSVRKYRPTIEKIHAPFALPGKLRKFSLEDNAHYAKPFLSSFLIPPDVDVTLIRARDYMDHGDFGADLDEITDNLDVPGMQTATRLLPDDRSLLPILPLVHKVVVRREFESFHSIIGTTPSGNIVELSGRASDDDEMDVRDGHKLLRDVVSIFSGAPIVELCIQSHGSSRIEEEDWILALNAFPTLERLSILGTGGGEWDTRYPLLDALQSVPRKKSRGKKKGKAISGARVPAQWPQLKSLTIVSDALRHEDEELAEALESCLKNRVERGCRLQELRLVLKYFYFHRPDDWDRVESDDDDHDEYEADSSKDEEETDSNKNEVDGYKDKVDGYTEGELDGYKDESEDDRVSEDGGENNAENMQRKELYAGKLQNLVEHLEFEFVNRW